MRIAIYCPDRHFVYDGATPDRSGVGGGLTVRIRIAAALAGRGHEVAVICNCAREAVYERVRYRPLESVSRIETDVLVMHSSGGQIDLTPLLAVPIEARARIFLLSGLDVAKRVHELRPDAIYVCSNFIRREMMRSGTFTEKLFVTHYGVNRWNWSGMLDPRRDERRLIYTSHPSKGFEAAREVARRLHAEDARFRLHYFGGSKLWGAAVTEEVPPPEPCLEYGGLINQKDLAGHYKRSGFLLQLQTRREPFGIIVVEAMAAGCLVVASPVGAFPELIEHGENGFLVEGEPESAATLDRAAALIADVARKPELAERVRKRALETPFAWAKIAEVWEAHLTWLLDRKAARHLEADWARCGECGSGTLALVDGYHCTACGNYGRRAAAMLS